MGIQKDVVPRVHMWNKEISIFFSIIYSFDRKFFLCYMFYLRERKETFVENQGMTEVLGMLKISKKKKILDLAHTGVRETLIHRTIDGR